MILGQIIWYARVDLYLDMHICNVLLCINSLLFIKYNLEYTYFYYFIYNLEYRGVISRKAKVTFYQLIRRAKTKMLP